MYFVSRLTLGQSLAQKISDLRGVEPVILCLKESSLSTCIALAAELRAWIYPLLIEPITISDESQTIGVLIESGEFCPNPEMSNYELEDLQSEYSSIIQDMQRNAYGSLNQRAASYGVLHKEALNGRVVIICGDIIGDDMLISAAQQFLRTIDTQKIISLAGNADVNSSEKLMLASERSICMDVIPNLFDDDHYFEQPDGYSDDEKRQLVMNIPQYWK